MPLVYATFYGHNVYLYTSHVTFATDKETHCGGSIRCPGGEHTSYIELHYIVLSHLEPTAQALTEHDISSGRVKEINSWQ